MNERKIVLFLLLLVCMTVTGQPHAEEEGYKPMMVRIAEIEIEPGSIEDYLAILKEESEASVRLEPGVICIYPMYEKENPTRIRLLEIYASKQAHESHLQTPHFLHYKTTTLPMVKSLKLVAMEPIDPGSMPAIFAKLTQ
jgi:quinol monooxygenase YgiN